jgi:AIPR protein
VEDRLLIGEFIEALQERADERYKGKLAQSFVDWYVEAEFGNVEWKFTDDSGDGGIDAVVRLPGDRPPAVIVQSKFSERIGRNLLGEKAYEEFDNVIEAFRDDDAFNEFLKTAREDARPIYRRVHEQLSDIGNWLTEKKAFRIISTSNRRRSFENDLVPRSAYCYADEILDLYRQYRKGHTPQARDLQLSVSDKLPYRDASTGVTSYLFNAKVSDFRRYCETNDVGRLVARNIRFYLGGKVGRSIRETYESEPQDFWYVHNGITIICDDYEEKNGVATLVNPSVVNGAQTLYAIAGSSRKVSPALVATRVVVRARRSKQAQEDDTWVQKIIRGVNTQNRVKAQDFRSNDPAQIELRDRFRDQKVFFERKRGEWREYRNEPRYRGFNRTTLKDVGLALAATEASDGSGVVLVKRGAEIIFGEDKHYQRLFPSRALIRHRFERIYFAYRLAKFVWDFGYRNAKEWNRQRHAYWSTVWLAHVGLTNGDHFFSRASVKSIRTAFNAFEGNGRGGTSAKKTIRGVREAVWRAWRRARRADIERWTANNFFKSQWGHKRVLRLAMPKVRRPLRVLAEKCVN